MRKKHLFAVLSFATTAAAVQTEEWCHANGVPGRLIPLPEEISAGCGLAWRMEPGEWEEFSGRMKSAELPFDRMTSVWQWVIAAAPEKQ